MPVLTSAAQSDGKSPTIGRPQFPWQRRSPSRPNRESRTWDDSYKLFPNLVIFHFHAGMDIGSQVSWEWKVYFYIYIFPPLSGLPACGKSHLNGSNSLKTAPWQAVMRLSFLKRVLIVLLALTTFMHTVWVSVRHKVLKDKFWNGFSSRTLSTSATKRLLSHHSTRGFSCRTFQRGLKANWSVGWVNKYAENLY